jgi:hypothetical protein
MASVPFKDIFIAWNGVAGIAARDGAPAYPSDGFNNFTAVSLNKNY